MNQVDEQNIMTAKANLRKEASRRQGQKLGIHGPIHGQLLDERLYHKAVHPETNASESAAFGSNFEDKTVYLFLRPAEPDISSAPTRLQS
jgi:hypothetical protein